jgi:serine/threonine protein kinase
MKNIQLKGYTITKSIGKGGMAEVFLAQNTIGKNVAIKIMLAKFIDEDQVVIRFKNEAKAMVALEHPNIRQVIDYGEYNNRPYIIQEYLDGTDLSERIGTLDDATLQNIWTKTLEGLQYSHTKNIIHRDIKPSNLFLTNHNQLKIVDFGIAKVQDAVSITGTGQALGSLLYMSPEQIIDPKRVSTATDVYSLAITMLHLIKGKNLLTLVHLLLHYSKILCLVIIAQKV